MKNEDIYHVYTHYTDESCELSTTLACESRSSFKEPKFNLNIIIMNATELKKLKKEELISKILEIQNKDCSRNVELDELQAECDSLGVQKDKLISQNNELKKELEQVKQKSKEELEQVKAKSSKRESIIKERDKTIFEQKTLIESLRDKEVLAEDLKAELDDRTSDIEALRKVAMISIVVAIIAVASAIIAFVI